MNRPSDLTLPEQDILLRKAKKRSGISFVAWLAAADYKRAKREDDLQQFAHNYLLRYSQGALLDGDTYNKFYELVAKELVDQN